MNKEKMNKKFWKIIKKSFKFHKLCNKIISRGLK